MVENNNSFAYHIEVELGLDINKIWNFEKNIVSPYEIKKQSKREIWLYCLKNDKHNYDINNKKIGYKTTCNNFYHLKNQKGTCGYCNSFASHKTHWSDSIAQWGIDNIDKDFLKKYWSDKNTLDPYTIAPQSSKKIWILCQEKDYHNDIGGYEVKCSDFITKNSRCPYCKKRYKIHKLDSLGYLYPQIAQMIVNDERNNMTIEDMYKIAPYSANKYYFRCNKCGKDSNNKKILKTITQNKYYSCEYCSDGISIPEKFMINILNQLNIEFQTQLNKSTFKWCNNYRYDFYIPISNMIIETHGNQHYKKNTLTKRTLKEEQLNDKLKKELALNNNIDNYIVIDCRYSEFDWLKENIIKELSPYFDLSNINWELAWEESQNSLCIKAWELFEKGYSIKQIAKELNICINTVYNYKKTLEYLVDKE